MRYFLIAGEPSGDLHGANLMRGIEAADPKAEFCFWGGDEMASVGGVENLRLHYRDSSFFGLFQVAKNIFTILGQIRLCQKQIAEFAPDVVIGIDYAGFNLKMMKFAKERGIKSYFYIAPKVWAWNEKRIEKIRRYVDELFIIFPFEKKYFGERGIEAHFEGNPLVDAIATRCENLPSRDAFVESCGLDSKPIIALLAGSRVTEIRDNLPLMQRVSTEFPGYQFVVAGVDWIAQAEYDKYLKDTDIKIVKGVTYELLKHSEAAVVTSGTATLETALIGTPQVVVYHIPWFHEKMRPWFLKIPYISLVNINLGREAVREIVRSTLDTTEIGEALQDILIGGEERAMVLNDYRELSEIIGARGASERFARRMVELLKI